MRWTDIVSASKNFKKSRLSCSDLGAVRNTVSTPCERAARCWVESDVYRTASQLRATSVIRASILPDPASSMSDGRTWSPRTDTDRPDCSEISRRRAAFLSPAAPWPRPRDACACSSSSTACGIIISVGGLTEPDSIWDASCSFRMTLVSVTILSNQSDGMHEG